jgi:hypothetical protein
MMQEAAAEQEQEQLKMKQSPYYLDVCSFLRCRKGTWVTARHMCSVIGVSDRELRIIKLAALEAGIPIASGDKGYMMTDNYDDMTEMIGRMRSQARKMLEQTNMICRIFGQPAEQMRLTL